MPPSNKIIGDYIENYARCLFGWEKSMYLWSDAFDTRRNCNIEIKATTPLIKTHNDTGKKRGRFNIHKVNHDMLASDISATYCFILYKFNKKSISILGIRLLSWKEVNTLISNTASDYKIINHKEIFGSNFTKKAHTIARIQVNL